jgi:hypothetical protein
MNHRDAFSHIANEEDAGHPYIGVCSSSDHVEVSNRSSILGMSANSPSHLATEQERERFHRVLKEHGYKWNQANKVIIKDEIEIIKI